MSTSVFKSRPGKGTGLTRLTSLGMCSVSNISPKVSHLVLCATMLLILAQLPGFFTQAAEEKPVELIKIVAANDLHLTDKASAAYPEKVVAAMNTEHAQLALVVGDLASEGELSELGLAKQVIDKLTVPYYVIRGNHDGTNHWATVFPQARETYSFSAHGIHFIGLDPGDSTPWQHKKADAQALQQLSKILGGIPAGEPIILFCHYPLVVNSSLGLENAEEVLELFKGRRLLAAISGHFHANTEIWKEGVLFTTTACASSTRNNHDKTVAKGYRVFEVDSQLRISTQFREVPGGATPAAPKKQKKKKA